METGLKELQLLRPPPLNVGVAGMAGNQPYVTDKTPTINALNGQVLRLYVMRGGCIFTPRCLGGGRLFDVLY